MDKSSEGGGEGLWSHSLLLQQGDQLPPGARIVSVTELARMGVAVSGAQEAQPAQHRVSVLTSDSLQRLLSSQPKPVVQSVLASPATAHEEQEELRLTLAQEVQHDYSRPQQVITRAVPHYTHQLPEHKLEEVRVTSLQDSRLVGVPTMGRVIQMSELNRLAIPEMKIVLQCDQKLDDLDALELPISQGSSLPLASYMGKQTLGDMHIEKKQAVMEELMMLPLADSSPMEPALIELAGQSLPYSLPCPPALPAVHHGTGPMNRVTDRSYPAVVTAEMLAEYKDATHYDTIWKCQGGRYKVHRLVLALASPFLKTVLEGQPEGDTNRHIIHTPDISSPSVRAILCLFYTGKVNVARNIMGEVNTALRMLKFHGGNVTVLPTQELVKQEIAPDFNVNTDDFCQVELERKGGSGMGERVKEEDALDDESDDEWNVDTAFDADLVAEADSDDDWWEAENKREQRKRKAPQTKDEHWSEEDEDGKSYTGFKRGRKSLKTPDTQEMFRTRGSGKGERSFQLSLDLFEGKNVDFIYICHCCYAIFDTFKKLALHKDDAHPENPDGKGPHHTDSPTQFNCPKCSQAIQVKHIVWFCKHLRYCRDNNDIANALMRPEEEESDGEENNQAGGRRKVSKRSDSTDGNAVYLKDTEERLRITGEAKGRNVQTLSRILVGRVVDYIWACKFCYSIHTTEEEFEKHKIENHAETELLVGKYWNANTENYTCPYCDQVQNSRHIVWFIYHMRKCNMSNVPFIKKENNEEEDTEEEEEMEGDEHDPDQIVLRTLNIRGERSEWLCESLLGKLVERIYSCHICYSVYETAAELKRHFKPAHGEIVNKAVNGPYYNVSKQAFDCPVCHKMVCKKHRNSIFFIYHFRKCAGQAFPLQKACQECGKQFSSYPIYKAHCDGHKAGKSFMCHVCTKVFPSNARLNYHVQYVHSAYKPFACTKCTKAYKRKAELLEHEEMSHSEHFNYSCDKCGKQFYGKKNLALHMKTHYTDDEKKHVCTVCGYRFAKIKFLKNHMTTHSDIRQYACEVCGARVKTRDTLKQHRKKLHNLLTPVPKNAEVEEPAREEVATPGLMVEDQAVCTEDLAGFTEQRGLETRVINTL